MKKPTLKVMNDYCKAHKAEDVILLLADDCELKITPSLSLEERLLFIERVSSFCINENGEELPEYFDLIFWTTVFQMMSNMPLPKIKNEESIDLTVTHVWINSLPADFIDKVRHAHNDYIGDLEWECRDKIAARARYATSMVGVMSSLINNAGAFSNAIQQIEEVNNEMISQTTAIRQLANVVPLE